MTYDYDLGGNILNRSDIGRYSYSNSTRPFQVSSVGSASYGYDANGNQTDRSGPGIKGSLQHLSYDVFDMPTRITTGVAAVATTTDLEYDGQGSRLIKRKRAGALADNAVDDCPGNPASCVTELTIDVGELYEQTSSYPAGSCDASAPASSCTPTTRTHQYRVYAAGRQVAQIKRIEQGGTTQAQTYFLHDDHLGTTSLLSDATTGDVIVKHEFSAFGEPKGLDFTNGSVLSGFAGLEHDDDFGLVNMRGRLYDPHLARFISADPFVTQPLNTQGLNRYAYVQNRPLNFTDPSGFEGHPGGGDQGQPSADSDHPADTGQSQAQFQSSPQYADYMAALTAQDIASAMNDEVSGMAASIARGRQSSGQPSGGHPGSPGQGATTTQPTDVPASQGASAIAAGSNGSDSNSGQFASSGQSSFVQWNPSVSSPASDEGKIADLLGLTVNSAGLGASIAEYTTPFLRVQNGAWRGLNGNWYPVTWGGNGATGARSLALSSGVTELQFVGKIAFGASTVIGLYQAADAVSNGDPQAAGRSMVDIGIGAVGTFGGPYAAALAGGYFVMEATVNYSVGSSPDQGPNIGGEGAGPR